MKYGPAAGVVVAYSTALPVVVILPILLVAYSTKHMLPSGPAVTPVGSPPADGTGNSVIVPVVVMRPILFPSASVNQRLPSGPAAIPNGWLAAVGIVNSRELSANIAAIGDVDGASHRRAAAARARRRGKREVNGMIAEGVAGDFGGTSVNVLA